MICVLLKLESIINWSIRCINYLLVVLLMDCIMFCIYIRIWRGTGSIDGLFISSYLKGKFNWWIVYIRISRGTGLNDKLFILGYRLDWWIVHIRISWGTGLINGLYISWYQGVGVRLGWWIVYIRISRVSGLIDILYLSGYREVQVWVMDYIYIRTSRVWLMDCLYPDIKGLMFDWWIGYIRISRGTCLIDGLFISGYRGVQVWRVGWTHWSTF